MNIINVTGNALLIYGLHCGVEGVAIPTLASRWVAAIVAVILLLNERYALHLSRSLATAFRWDVIGKILRVGVPNGVENSVFQLGKLLTLRLITSFGTAAIAANAVAVILTNIISLPGWGIGQATTIVAAHCLGAKETEQAKHYNRVLMLAATVTLTLWGGMICLMFPLLLPMFHLSADAVTMAKRMTHIHYIGCIFFWAAAFGGYPNTMRAAGDVRFAMLASIGSMWLFRVGGAYLLPGPLGMGATGVWLAMVVDWAFRAICFSLRWRSGKWEAKRVI